MAISLITSYTEPALYFFAALIIAVLSRVFFSHFLAPIVEKTKTEWDDILVHAFKDPIFYFIVFSGAYLAAKALPELQQNAADLDSAFFVLVVFVVALFTSRLMSAIIAKWVKRKRHLGRSPKIISKIIYVIVYLAGLIVVLAYFRIEVTPLLTALGVGGLALGLALQTTLSNFFAGLNVISDEPIKVGDYVEIKLDNGENAGYIEDVGWRSTRMRTLLDTVVIIPNGKLAESVITNYSLPKKDFSILVDCGVAYESDMEKVEKLTLKVAKKIQQTVEGATRDFEPILRYYEFGESNIKFRTILRVDEFPKRFFVQKEFMKALKKEFDKNKIEISWPIRKIYNIDTKKR